MKNNDYHKGMFNLLLLAGFFKARLDEYVVDMHQHIVINIMKGESFITMQELFFTRYQESLNFLDIINAILLAKSINNPIPTEILHSFIYEIHPYVPIHVKNLIWKLLDEVCPIKDDIFSQFYCKIEYTIKFGNYSSTHTPVASETSSEASDSSDIDSTTIDSFIQMLKDMYSEHVYLTNIILLSSVVIIIYSVYSYMKPHNNSLELIQPLNTELNHKDIESVSPIINELTPNNIKPVTTITNESFVLNYYYIITLFLFVLFIYYLYRFIKNRN